MKTTTSNRFSDIKTIIIFVAIYGVLFAAISFPNVGIPVLLGISLLSPLVYFFTHRVERQ